MKVILIFTALFLMFCSESPTESRNPIIEESSRLAAPAFTLNSLSHGTQMLSQYSDKVVYLFFLGYNCPPCIGSAPSVQTQIANKYGSSVQVLGLDVWNGSSGNMSVFQSQTNVTYPLLLNASNVGSDYGANNDYSVVVDQLGEIAYKGRGVNISQIQAVIDELLSE